MNLALSWHKPLTLKRDLVGHGIYTIPLGGIPKAPGIYIFLRRHGNKVEALYVGQAIDLRVRIKQHLNNLALMKGIEHAANGTRLVVFGEFVAKPGQQQKKALARMENAYIRHYLSAGHQLLNKQGTKIKSDTIASTRPRLKKFIPLNLYFES